MMIDWIKSWFGKGKIRFEIKTKRHGSGVAKLSFVGSDFVLTDLFEHVAKDVLVEKGAIVTEIKFVGFSGHGLNCEDLSYQPHVRHFGQWVELA